MQATSLGDDDDDCGEDDEDEGGGDDAPFYEDVTVDPTDEDAGTVQFDESNIEDLTSDEDAPQFYDG